MTSIINASNLVITNQQWTALFPHLTLLAGAIFSLLFCTVEMENIHARRMIIFCATVASVLVAGAWQSIFWIKEPLLAFNGALTFDYFSSFVNVLLLGGLLLVLMACYQYLEKEAIHYSEFYSIILISTLGMMLLTSASELLTIFISLELMSLGVYVLVGLRRRDRLANEAAVKYFVMGGVAAAILLYGISMIYGATGTTKLVDLGSKLSASPELISNPILVLGLMLLLIGFLFKIAAVPFHMWTPDVYEGAPTVVTGYMSTLLKAAVFASFTRVLIVTMGNAEVKPIGHLYTMVHDMIWVLSLLTMLIGNLLALTQTNLKRLLAYSAIAHTGYLLLGVLAGPNAGFQGILIYLVSYVAMNVGIFGILAIASGANDSELNTDNFTGLGTRRPFFAAAMVVFLMSLAGLPPTAGFVGKYFLFSGALAAGETLLVLIAVLLSVISVFYYMKIVVQMYMRESTTPVNEHWSGQSIFGVIAVTMCLLLTIKFGIMPEKLLEMTQKAALFQ